MRYEFCQESDKYGLCQPFLGILITPVNSAFYLCTLFLASTS